MKPLLAAAAGEVADDQLVAAVREGSEEAFEALYRRYRPQIVAYVRRKVGDHARAEDIAQEAFMSALRALRSSDQEIAFRPWVYEIAKNACTDHLRRAGRAPEVSIDSDDFSPQDEGRISQSVSGTDAEVARREKLESLQMAFGDLPAAQHQILVMRELEGLSYERIGSRMGLTRGAVESMLFRARRTLKDGFDDIDTGERCHRVHVAMEALAGRGRVGLREWRRLTVHLRQCAECRRAAVGMGLDDLALASADRPGRFRRLGALLPLPLFIRRRIGDTAGALNSIGPGAEQGASLAGKAAAVVVAAALAAGGAGLATRASGGALPLPGALGGGSRDSDVQGGKGGTAKGAGRSEGPSGRESASGAGSGADRSGAPQGAGGSGDNSGQAGNGGQGPSEGGAPDAGGLTGSLPGKVGDTTGSVGSLVGSTGDTVNRTGKQVTDLTGDTLQDVTGGGTPKLPTPEVDVPDTGISLPGNGGGSSAPRLPDPGDVSVPQVQVPQTPTVQLPGTGISVPDTGVRLP